MVSHPVAEHLSCSSTSAIEQRGGAEEAQLIREGICNGHQQQSKSQASLPQEEGRGVVSTKCSGSTKFCTHASGELDFLIHIPAGKFWLHLVRH